MALLGAASVWAGPPSSDLCEDAIGPLAVPSVESGTTIGATFDNVGLLCGTSNTAPGVWYTVTGTGNTMTATTCENQSFPGSADYDTKISVFCDVCRPVSSCCVPSDFGREGCDDPDCEAVVCAVDEFCCETDWDSICAGEAADLCGDLCPSTCVAGNDDESGCNFHSTVTWCSQAGAEYRTLVHGFGSATGNFELAVSDDGAPCTATVNCLPEGACCFFDGSCIVSTEIDCSAQGGEYQGDDTECTNPEGLPRCPQPDASLDIKPGSCPNPLNLTSRGVLPVALVGIPELNAADVDRSTLEISRADGVGGSVAPLAGRPGPRRNLEDVATPFDGELCDCHALTGDGVLDLSMKFDIQELRSVLELDSVDKRAFVELCVTGSLNDGTPFRACDCVRIQAKEGPNTQSIGAKGSGPSVNEVDCSQAGPPGPDGGMARQISRRACPAARSDGDKKDGS